MPLPVPDWKEVHAWLRANFPDVHHLSVDELSAWKNDPVRPKPVLVDIRAPAEQAVSSIDGACFAQTEPDAIEKLRGLPADTPIVAYCAVGLRSANLARELRKAGFTNVQNLEGAIFAWANRGLPLTCATGPTTKVHPYDKHWGALLDPERRSTSPDISSGRGIVAEDWARQIGLDRRSQ